MPNFHYSEFDGSEEFSPQSADKLFDELSKYMLNYGEDILRNLDDWQDEHPELIDALIKRGLIEKDTEGKFVVTPRGIKRVENRALEELFNITRKDKLGKHETEFRGAGQTVHDETKPYEYGDPVANLDLHGTLRNAISRRGRRHAGRSRRRRLRRLRHRVSNELRHGRAARHVRQHEPLRQVRPGEAGGDGAAGAGPRPLPGRLDADRRLLHLRQPADRAGIALQCPEAGEHLRLAGAVPLQHRRPRRRSFRSTSRTSTRDCSSRGDYCDASPRRTSKSSA